MNELPKKGRAFLVYGEAVNNYRDTLFYDIRHHNCFNSRETCRPDCIKEGYKVSLVNDIEYVVN